MVELTFVIRDHEICFMPARARRKEWNENALVLLPSGRVLRPEYGRQACLPLRKDVYALKIYVPYKGSKKIGEPYVKIIDLRKNKIIDEYLLNTPEKLEKILAFLYKIKAPYSTINMVMSLLSVAIEHGG